MLFWLARVAATIGYQMLAVVIGWKIYEITGSAFDLGLVGLIQFVPAVVLTLLIGHTADRYDRRLIVRIAQGVYALAAIVISFALFTGALSRDLLFAAVFLIGSARAFEMPTVHALVPAMVPGSMLARAVAAWTSANQVAVICGPALGGLIYVVEPGAGERHLPRLLQRRHRAGQPGAPERRAAQLASRRRCPRCWPASNSSARNRRLLGVITLDLFVVVLGGATALLPIYARDILAGRPDRPRPAALGAGGRRA